MNKQEQIKLCQERIEGIKYTVASIENELREILNTYKERILDGYGSISEYARSIDEHRVLVSGVFNMLKNQSSTKLTHLLIDISVDRVEARVVASAIKELWIMKNKWTNILKEEERLLSRLTKST